MVKRGLWLFYNKSLRVLGVLVVCWDTLKTFWRPLVRLEPNLIETASWTCTKTHALRRYDQRIHRKTRVEGKVKHVSNKLMPSILKL